MKIIRHILLVTPSFPLNDEQSTVIPPLQFYVKDIMRKYPKLRVSIVCLHFPFISEKYIWHGVHVYPLNGKNGSLLTRPFLWQKVLRMMRKIHHDQPVDMVHSFWYQEATFLVQRFARRFQIPHYATLMGQDAKADNRYRKLINPRATNLVCLSDFQRKIFEQHCPGSVAAVIPFGISANDSCFHKPWVENRTIDLLCVSSLIPLKRVHLFIQLVDKMRRLFPNIKAEIVGEGKLRSELEQQIKSLNLENQVILRGQLDRSTCIQKMYDARVLVHTSEYEGQGYVLNEALAAGCRVFATSKSLMVEDKNYSLVLREEELFAQVKVFLESSSQTFNSVFPIRMEDTIEAYESLFRKGGITFQESPQKML